MGIDTGFKNYGFVDDREEREKWGLIEEKLSNPKSQSSEEEDVIDGKMEINDDSTSEWVEDMQKSSVKEYKRKSLGKKRNFFQRNKREIIDALIILGVVYVGYKLFFEKDEEFDHGGEVDYTPTPQSMPSPEPAPMPVNPAPPRPEMPEATYNPE